MKTKLLIILLSLVSIFMGITMALSLFPIFTEQQPEKYISPSDVRGMAIQHSKQLYTLNYEQQTATLAFLNNAEPVSHNLFINSFEHTPFKQIVIYVFNGPDITIKPVGYDDGNLIFESINWNKDGWLKESSNGKLKSILEQTYE